MSIDLNDVNGQGIAPSVGTILYLFDRNSLEPRYFVVVSISPRFLLFSITDELHSFVLMSPELLKGQMQLREDLLEGFWIDCTRVIDNFDFEEVVGLTRSRSNVVVGNLSSPEIRKLRQLLAISETLESFVIKDLLRGLHSYDDPLLEMHQEAI